VPAVSGACTSEFTIPFLRCLPLPQYQVLARSPLDTCVTVQPQLRQRATLPLVPLVTWAPRGPPRPAPPTVPSGPLQAHAVSWS
jgi:hypothetical protein